MIKNCKNCGKEFQTKTKSIYCSDQCRTTKRKQYQKEYHHNWQHQNADRYNEYMREYFSDGEKREKQKARCKANNQIYSGKKSRASKCQHPRCKETAHLEQHHICYDGLGALATVTLCSKHHKELHAAERKARAAIKQDVTAKVVLQ